jgi:hypothetical protein
MYLLLYIFYLYAIALTFQNSFKEDMLRKHSQRQKRPTTVSKETYYSAMLRRHSQHVEKHFTVLLTQWF